MVTGNPTNDEVREIIDDYNLIVNNIDLFLEFIDREQRNELDNLIRIEVREMLYSNFVNALNAIDEYSGPGGQILKDHLLDNVIFGDHVQVNGGRVTQVWNTNYAGDWTDVRRGQEAAWALSPKSPNDSPYWRSFYWKFIYLGVPPSKLEWKSFDDNLYNEIIEARMAAWGEQAPYWIFVEFGTTAGDGEGTPYPQFSGQQPIYKTLNAAQDLAEDIIAGYVEQVYEFIAQEAEEAFVGYDYHSVIEVEEKILTKWGTWYERNGEMIRRLHYKSTGRLVAKAAGFGEVIQRRPL